MDPLRTARPGTADGANRPGPGRGEKPSPVHFWSITVTKKKTGAPADPPAPLTAAAPPTPMMAAVGLNWSDVFEYAKTAVRLIQANGDDVIDAFAAGFRAFAALGSRDFLALFAAVGDANRSAQKVVDAIRQEFGLSE